MFALHILYNHLPQTWVRFTVKYFGDIFSGVSAPNVTSIAEATKRVTCMPTCYVLCTVQNARSFNAMSSVVLSCEIFG